MNRSLILGIVFSGTAVILGAFGAHALRVRLDAAQLQTFETGVRYQMYHGLALILLGLAAARIDLSWTHIALWLFVAGILFFSGSLYLLSMKSMLGIEHWKFLGPITPFGGLCLILGWASFLAACLKKI